MLTISGLPAPAAVLSARNRPGVFVCAAARLVLVGVALNGMSLAGCAYSKSGHGSVTGASSPSPTAACPRVDEMPDQQQCATYDPDAAMMQNERYREQRTISPHSLAQIDAYVEPRTDGTRVGAAASHRRRH